MKATAVSFAGHSLQNRTLLGIANAIAYFNENVDKSGVCWQWTGSLSHKGYGRIYIDRSSIPAHRFSWVMAGNPLNIHLEIDHICRNRACVNPAHLEQVSRGENQRRGNGFSGINYRKTHCAHGHPFDEENTLHLQGKRAGRQCRTCNRLRAQARAALGAKS